MGRRGRENLRNMEKDTFKIREGWLISVIIFTGATSSEIWKKILEKTLTSDT